MLTTLTTQGAMRGIRKPGKAAITATAGLLGLTLVPFQSFAAEAATSGCATAGVLAEREAKFAELLNKADQARALVAEKNFNEADKLYRELISGKFGKPAPFPFKPQSVSANAGIPLPKKGGR